ncbi:hypothetical protein [Parapedobacter soli]|uniref:hypothetical protein n=1 Tax=Parapedobacter soli TaxID=416955 RepID=UPI0021C651A7|nr:hypothetical protein [Parapedobacter soli]
MRTLRKGTPEHRECLEALVLANNKGALLALKKKGNVDFCVLNDGVERLPHDDKALLLVRQVATDGHNTFQVVEKDEVVPDPIYIAGKKVVFILPDNHRD